MFALASARGKAGVAVVRISGPLAHDAVAALANELPASRVVGLRRLTWRGVELDQGLVILFDAGASFTGEDVAELHLHGSIAVLNVVLQVLSEMPGLRMADPGEFTRRAMENGCLDLAQVEGLADLIDAETEAQRRQALRVLSGAIGERAEAWRRDLIRAAALLEATIDFVDDDVPVDVRPEVWELLGGLLTELHREADGSRIAERIRDGFEVAIIGAPNTGKSTLLNALAGRDAAITSHIAGTTRDIIEVRMDIGGLAVTLLDTAGIRKATDQIEEIGIDRSLARAGHADLCVFLLDQGGIPVGLEPGPDDILVYGKADIHSGGGLRVSGKTGQGIADLVGMIEKRLSSRSGTAGTMTRERHRIAIMTAIRALESASSQIEASAELAAEELRVGIRALDSLIGRVDVEDLLDDIFTSFCIGK
ncbi:MAG: tRNA uridine-5-carboxymethylaminomethyl(34) synthesis GTPase MnmE [Methylophilaceae bacterium]|nr:tRNA uridine-5-carboxymethylaminomethyl(34) synthesis GTPase MnmE [Methylophilaceae bacterium]